MYLELLNFNNFRNLKNSKISFNPNLNIFIGENGQGKSNLLEAIYFLLSGESFRYGSFKEFIHWNENASSIKGKIISNELSFDNQISFIQNKKKVMLNNKPITGSKLKNLFSPIIFSPESLTFVKEGPDFRRDLLDESLISSNKHNYELIVNFRKFLKSRNKILRDIKDNHLSLKEGENLLASIFEKYIELATKMSFLRISHLKEILPLMNSSLQKIFGTDQTIDAKYMVSDFNAFNESYESLKTLLKKRLIELKDAELSCGTSLVGPHKHDVIFLLDNKDSRFYCSQGQQRILILAFRIAQIHDFFKKHNNYPVLLLDDVFSELDEQKRNNLIHHLLSLKTQIFITTTDLNNLVFLQKSEPKIFKVRRGEISI